MLTTYLSSSWYVCHIRNQCVFKSGSSLLAHESFHNKKTVKENKLNLVNEYQEKFHILNGRIHFKLGAREPLKSKAVLSYLKEVSEKWKENPEATIQVVGHTDNKGARKSNYQLGLFRAKIITRGLVAQGVSQKKIKTRSLGEDQPLSSNRTSRGRFNNRRVEINIQ